MKLHLKQASSTYKSFDRLKRAIKYSSPPKGNVIAIFILSLIISALAVVEPLVLKFIFDSLEHVKKDIHTIIKGMVLLLTIALLRNTFSSISNWLIWKTRITIHHNVLSVTLERLYSMRVDSHREQGVGAIMNRVEKGIQGYIGAVSEIAFNVLPAITYFVFSVFAMLHLDWKLTAVVLFFVPLPALIQYKAAPKQIARENLLFKRWGKIFSRFNEVLAGIVTVRSFAMEKDERVRFLNDVSQTNSTVIRGIGFDSGVGALQNFIIALARIAAIILGSYLVFIGQITVGAVVAFLGYVGVLFGPVQGLNGVYRIVKTASVSLDHIFSILDSKEFIEDAPNAIELKSVRGRVQFKDVCFAYKNKESILKEFNLDVKPGKTVAVVGPSGAGKSTLMSLLQRFYDVDGGSITIDGTDIRSVRQMSLRKQIGMVQQEVILFNDTIRNNISYGSASASDHEIVEAAKTANIHDFIMSLEDGYETIVGERGGLLSMGERQRVAIARAILKNPPILILDEATSSLDAELESAVQYALNKLISNRTTFIIAHRLATVVKADQIIVLKEGKIIESGNHIELLMQEGYYSSLVKKQTKDLVLM